MTILLHDIRAAFLDYLDTSVNSIIGPVIAQGPNTMNPNEIGFFIVTVDNAGEPNGVALTNVRFHLRLEPLARAQFQVPASSIATVRATTNGNDPVLLPGNLVPEMIVFPPTSTLAVGGSIQVSGLKVKALQLGDVTITCHVHAEADQNFLFPSDRNRDDSTDFEVV